jgi:hypothetical protein
MQGSTLRDSRNYELRSNVTPKQAADNAADLIGKAEGSAADPDRCRALLECADRWLALALALANEPRLIGEGNRD